jgi:hypothetical protein
MLLSSSHSSDIPFYHLVEEHFASFYLIMLPKKHFHHHLHSTSLYLAMLPKEHFHHPHSLLFPHHH